MTKGNKPQQQQQQGKRKAEAPVGGAPKKAKDQSGAAAAPAAAAPKKGAEQQGKKGAAAAQEQQKKGKKQPEPEPEEEEDDDDDDDDDQPAGEVDEEKLKAAEAVQADMDKIADELEQLDEKQNAELFVVQKKYLLQKRPVLSKRDALLAKVPGLWKTLLSEHEVFAVQLEEVDDAILDYLSCVEVQEHFSAPSEPKQQLVAVDVHFTFSSGSAHVKAGKYTKTFKFDDENETLLCVAASKLPFVSGAFAKEHTDSFFHSWFASEGMDEGILRAQDALSSELYVDPLQLFKHVASGGKLDDIHNDDDDDDQDALAMAFGSDDDEAPELADE